MLRIARAARESYGSDTLLEVVTNVIGILIVLIMVVAQRARHDSSLPSPPAAQSSSLTAAQQSAQTLEADVHHVAAEIQAVEAEIAARYQQRGQLATLIQAANEELARRRGALEGESRSRYDLTRELALGRAKLAQLEKLRDQVAQARPTSIKIESYPTPISKTVDGKEAHFQIRGGRITWIPLDPLLDKFKSVAPTRASLLRDQPELTETLGPIDGFRLRYTLERYDVPFEPVPGGARGGGSLIQLTRWELVPTSAQLGESVETALSAKSLFRARLDPLKPAEWTITLWVYADSFDEFRALKKELYQMGYATAGRPLPEGVPIGGSPKGSKSAAE